MTHDISRPDQPPWMARTLTGMVLLDMERAAIDRLAGGDLIVIRHDAGEVVVARLIGPVAGEPAEAPRWRIDGHYRVDATGARMAEIAPAPSLAMSDAGRHDWGALGLPEGLDTRVRPVDDPPGVDEVTLAHASSGHRSLDGNPLLTMTPGDRVTIDGAPATVLSIDRRKRTVAVERCGEAIDMNFDDVHTQETT